MSILTPTGQVALIYVSNLPSASSFYSALTQPLGIQYLSHVSVSPACLHFGYISQTAAGPRKTVVFSITESATPLPLNRITVKAPSEQAVIDFHAKSWSLNPQENRGPNILERREGEERAVTTDFDGNELEAVYTPPVRSSPPRGERPEVASTEKEASRVELWQEEVARSIMNTERHPLATRSESGAIPKGGAQMMRRADSYPLPVRESPRLIRRETTTTTIHYREPENKEASTSTSNAILGSILGVAAAAGLAAYVLTRSTSPDPLPGTRGNGGTSHFSKPGPIEIIDRESIERTVVPAKSYVSERDRGGSEERKKPSYVRYSITAPPKEVKRIDERSYHSSHAGTDIKLSNREYDRESQRPRTIVPDLSPIRRVEPPKTHTREMIIEKVVEREASPSRESHVSRRSHASHRTHKSSTSRSPRDRESSDRKDRGTDGKSSYTSARSHHTHHTSSTVKPAVPIPPPAADISDPIPTRHRTRRSSHREHDREHISGSPTSQYSSSPSSARTARNIPLPESTTGRSEYDKPMRAIPGLGPEYLEYAAADGRNHPYENAGKNGYAASMVSVAPSDSISSVGVKKERNRLKERMGEREWGMGMVGGERMSRYS